FVSTSPEEDSSIPVPAAGEPSISVSTSTTAALTLLAAVWAFAGWPMGAAILGTFRSGVKPPLDTPHPTAKPPAASTSAATTAASSPSQAPVLEVLTSFMVSGGSERDV